MVGCSILGCKSRSERKVDGITFHSFPFIPEIRNKWLEATGRQNWQPTKNTKICSVHFNKESFVYKEKKTHLKPCSIPNRDIHITSIPNPRIDSLSSTQPSTSQMSYDCPQAVGVKRRADNILQELQNIQPKRQCLKPPINLQHFAVSEPSGSKDALPLPLTPKKEKLLKLQLRKEQIKSSNRLKKLRAARESKRRLSKKTARLINIITELKCKMRVNSEELDILSNIERENVDFLKRYLDKENRPNKYSASLRKFALCLHFISPKAYVFVRKQFDTCLPHPKTLYRWYKSIDCDPGFTNESFECIKLMVSKSTEKILCSVSLDEMAIRQHLQWDGKQIIGYVNVGDNLDTDNLPLAKDALVFMVTSLNKPWKIPVGYFLTNGVNGEQRCALLKNCIHLLLECGVEIISITFDGCPANFAMAKLLGAMFEDVNNIDPQINVAGKSIAIIPDACHMLKLVRNTLADKKVIFNGNNEMISWDYFDKLHNLQQNEGMHLANKLRRTHIDFRKQVMKVRLAAQTFSRSVAEAMLFCRDDLILEDFLNSGATIEFIRHFNDIFDILNSRRLFTYGFKKPISKETFLSIDVKLKELEIYIKNLKFSSGPVVQSGRKTGFLGFLICLKAVRVIFTNHINIQNATLQYLCTYKLSQDHLELFFSAIRSKGGFNNNPTALQFKSAYRRLLIHGELKNISTGNCVPLESINILTCNMTSVCRKINSRRERLLTFNECVDNDDQIFNLPEGHDYIGNCEMTEYSKQATIYIAGYITISMKKIIKCDECLQAITSNRFPSLISRKDIGGLHYPSHDVIKICLFAEQILRQTIAIHGSSYFSHKHSLPRMLCLVLNKFVETRIFNDLRDHINEQGPLDNHLTLLIKAISLRYFEVRIHFITKSTSQRQESIRSMHTKLILFKGQ